MNAFTFFLGLTTRQGTNLILDSGMTRADIGGMIAGILSLYGIDGFSLTWGEGYWMGSPEPSVQVYVSGVDATNAQCIARDLAARFQQESVGLRQDNELAFIEPVASTTTVSEL